MSTAHPISPPTNRLRLLLDRYFEERHLAALDSEEQPEDELYRESE
jgi:hypothetical protein